MKAMILLPCKLYVWEILGNRNSTRIKVDEWKVSPNPRLSPHAPAPRGLTHRSWPATPCYPLHRFLAQTVCARA